MPETANARPRPTVLLVLDGWGHREAREHNAIAHANTPHWDRLLADYPHGLLEASELDVGLPEGQMGNSEVGHMNIGSGRVVMQDLPRIDEAIKNGSLEKNPALLDFIAALKQSGGTCHLMGLISPGGVHSHQKHIAILAKLVATHGVPVRVHAFLDGRDTPPKSAEGYLAQFIKDSGNATIATVSGRYYAMDRDKRWPRVEIAYRALAEGHGPKSTSALEALMASYAENLTDEFVKPVVIGDYAGMNDGDGVLMGNFRADRVREILTALLDPAFKEFSRPHSVQLIGAIGMMEYSAALKPLMSALFPPEKLTAILGEVMAKKKLTQLRIAETEKYAHVTFFFNGGREEPFEGEDRILVPSPNVATYDLKPEMSAFEVTDRLVDAIASGKYDLIAGNYANTDMVGHSGDMAAATKAVEAVDTCLGRVRAAVEKAGGALMITADHGNAEQLFDPESGQSHTAHTLNPVPVIICAASLKGTAIDIPRGRLADIAPTILDLMQLEKPVEMTGTSLLVNSHAHRRRA